MRVTRSRNYLRNEVSRMLVAQTLSPSGSTSTLHTRLTIHESTRSGTKKFTSSYFVLVDRHAHQEYLASRRESEFVQQLHAGAVD
jgi:hypothetical protein